MKRSIYWRQRQYVGNYLVSLITHSETFHIINIWWFSTKVCHKFCRYNICSAFSARSIYKGAKRTLQYMPNKNIQLPGSFIVVHVWHFQWRKFEAQHLGNIYVRISRFFKMYWSFCAKNNTTLIMKTLIWNYSCGKVKLIYRSG